MAINFISSKDSDETRIMNYKSDNIEIMIGSKTDKVIEELFESLLQRHQEGLEKSMKGNEFIFNSVDILYYNLNKISLVRVGTYIDTAKCIKNKIATINLKNNYDKCFIYAITAALNLKQIKSLPQRISNIKPFINQYNC